MLTLTGTLLDLIENAFLEVTMVHTYEARRVRKQTEPSVFEQTSTASLEVSSRYPLTHYTHIPHALTLVCALRVLGI